MSSRSPNPGRVPRVAVALAAPLALGACVVTSGGDRLVEGKTRVADEDLRAFERGRATRADVLLTYGDPSARIADDRVIVYEWRIATLDIAFLWPVPVALPPITRDESAAFRFDDRGILVDSGVFAPRSITNLETADAAWKKRAEAAGAKP